MLTRVSQLFESALLLICNLLKVLVMYFGANAVLLIIDGFLDPRNDTLFQGFQL